MNMRIKQRWYSFRWKGLNKFQEKEQGEIIARTKEYAQKDLLQRGFTQLLIQRNWKLNTAPTTHDLSQFFSQLGMLLKATIPMKTALQIILQDCTQLGLYPWISALIASLNQGYSLSYALLKENKYLTPQELSLIKIGEKTGKMSYLLEQIANHQKRRVALHRKVQKIMLYPSVVLGISLILTLLLLIFIVPQFSQMYKEHQQTLPIFTQFLLILSQFIRTQGIYLGIVIASIAIFIKYFYPQIITRLLYLFRYYAPFFKNFNTLNRQYYIAQNLGLMLNAGIPLEEALSCFIQPSNKFHKADPLLQISISKTHRFLLQGYTFSMAVSSYLFSPQAKKMLQLGEQTGTLPIMLEKIAEDTQEKLNHQIDLLSQLIEPLLMLVIGGLIGLIMLGMYLPIFNMGSLIQG